MLKQQSIPLDLPSDHHVVMFPTRNEPHLPAERPAQSAGFAPIGRRTRAKKRAIRQIAVVEVVGRLRESAEDLDRAIMQALAEGPRGVVCDLTAPLEGARADAIEVLAMAGRHVRDWPGIPVAVACPDRQVREALLAHPLGAHLIVAESMFTAITAVSATPYLTVQCLRLAPHPTAPRASREFVTRTLLDWRMSRVIPFASLVVSELVACSTINAGTDVELSVTWDRGALRLTVQDHGPALPDQRPSGLDLHGRGLTVVGGLSRAFGVLPTEDGGKVVWAVLEAPGPRPSTINKMGKSRPEPVQGAGIVKAV